MTNRILIVDDDKEMCEEISEVLRDEGYNVTAVLDGIPGKSIIENESIDLILLDLKIPGLSGFEILRIIRSQEIKVKVIVVSGRPLVNEFKNTDKDFIEEEVILKLADRVIKKPFDIFYILNNIKELLGSRSS